VSVSTIGVGLSSSFSSKYENRAKKEKTDLHPFAVPRQPCIQRGHLLFFVYDAVRLLGYSCCPALLYTMLFHSDSPSSGTVVARSTTHKRREARFLLGIPAKHLQATSVV